MKWSEGVAPQSLEELGQELLSEEVRRYDVRAKAIEVEGVAYDRGQQSTTTYLSALGPLRVERYLYARTDQEAKGVCPMEWRCGIVNGLFTARAARQSAFALAHLTSRDAEALLVEIGNMSPSRSTLDRLPKIVSEQWESHREEWERALCSQETVPAEAAVLVISQDGVMAPMIEGERSKKRANPDK